MSSSVGGAASIGSEVDAAGTSGSDSSAVNTASTAATGSFVPGGNASGNEMSGVCAGGNAADAATMGVGSVTRPRSRPHARPANGSIQTDRQRDTAAFEGEDFVAVHPLRGPQNGNYHGSQPSERLPSPNSVDFPPEG